MQVDLTTLLRLLLIAPLLEEWITRAGLQEYLLRRGLSGGALVTLGVPALFFSLLHLWRGWEVALAVFLPGLAFGLLYQRWRDWRLCALVHAVCNGFALTFCNFNT